MSYVQTQKAGQMRGGKSENNIAAETGENRSFLLEEIPYRVLWPKHKLHFICWPTYQPTHLDSTYDSYLPENTFHSVLK